MTAPVEDPRLAGLNEEQRAKLSSGEYVMDPVFGYVSVVPLGEDGKPVLSAADYLRSQEAPAAAPAPAPPAPSKQSPAPPQG